MFWYIFLFLLFGSFQVALPTEVWGQPRTVTLPLPKALQVPLPKVMVLTFFYLEYSIQYPGTFILLKQAAARLLFSLVSLPHIHTHTHTPIDNYFHYSTTNLNRNNICHCWMLQLTNTLWNSPSLECLLKMLTFFRPARRGSPR